MEGISAYSPTRVIAAEPARPALDAVDFSRSPFIVIWELTRACALVCLHCRAEAIPRRDPQELTTAEGIRLIEAVERFGRPAPLLVFTGGGTRSAGSLARTTATTHCREKPQWMAAGRPGQPLGAAPRLGIAPGASSSVTNI